MTPGDIVRCIDARYSEGRLVEGWKYVVKQVRVRDELVEYRNPDVPDSDMGLKLWGTSNIPTMDPLVESWWKSSRFVPVNRKDLETEILAKVADKIMGGAR